MIEDKEFQTKHLEKIFNDGSFSPVFKPNRKYSYDGEARIAYNDIRSIKS
jgi:hypothetical protein